MKRQPIEKHRLSTQLAYDPTEISPVIVRDPVGVPIRDIFQQHGPGAPTLGAGTPNHGVPFPLITAMGAPQVFTMPPGPGPITTTRINQLRTARLAFWEQLRAILATNRRGQVHTQEVADAQATANRLRKQQGQIVIDNF